MTMLTERRDQCDVGDKVLRKFRYQHAYGVILAIRMITDEKWGCKAVWCEQHEDILVEYEEGHFDAWQVKTKKSESGEWELNDDSLLNSIARFLIHDKKFPGEIQNFYFVSNTHYSDSNAEKREHLSPIKLLKAVDSVSSHSELQGKSLDGFNHVKNAIGVDAKELFSVLKRLDFVLGPTERAYEDEICQRHIAILSQCQSASAPVLAKIRESLIARVAYAASLTSDDPCRDWIGLTKEYTNDPYLFAKRVTAEDITLGVIDVFESGVRFPSFLASINLETVGQKADVLQKKLGQGGLAARYEVMRRRSIVAEQELLDLATRSNSEWEKCSQIENIVFGECDDAFLRASSGQSPFGSLMLIDVQDRLKRIAENEPKKVHRVPYEVLVGVAGLLTSECKVWWSDEFDLGEEQ